MKFTGLALAICFVLTPLEAAPKSHSVNTHVVKVKKNKVKGRKPVKRQSRSRSRVN